jgi:hypothetical protein
MYVYSNKTLIEACHAACCTCMNLKEVSLCVLETVNELKSYLARCVPDPLTHSLS